MSAVKSILIAVIVTAAIGMTMTAPHVFARHLSDSQRYNDGFNDGSQAATSARQNGNQFNPACDPTGAHTSDGQHTTIYCTGWANGYTSVWNGNSGQQGGFSQNDNDGQGSNGGNGGQGSSLGSIAKGALNACLSHLTTCATILGHFLS
jgi:hypothetical protein